MLVGEAGVGKSTILQAVATHLKEDNVAAPLSRPMKDVKMMSLNMGALVAGTEYCGQFENRLARVFKEVVQANGIVILCIEEIHMALGAGCVEGLAMNLANLLKLLLDKEEIRCIGTMTISEYRQYVESDPAFERRFEVILVEQSSKEASTVILLSLQDSYASELVVIGLPRPIMDNFLKLCPFK